MIVTCADSDYAALAWILCAVAKARQRGLMDVCIEPIRIHISTCIESNQMYRHNHMQLGTHKYTPQVHRSLADADWHICANLRKT
jgi:hypothetical protein